MVSSNFHVTTTRPIEFRLRTATVRSRACAFAAFQVAVAPIPCAWNVPGTPPGSPQRTSVNEHSMRVIPGQTSTNCDLKNPFTELLILSDSPFRRNCDTGYRRKISTSSCVDFPRSRRAGAKCSTSAQSRSRHPIRSTQIIRERPRRPRARAYSGATKRTTPSSGPSSRTYRRAPKPLDLIGTKCLNKSSRRPMI